MEDDTNIIEEIKLNKRTLIKNLENLMDVNKDLKIENNEFERKYYKLKNEYDKLEEKNENDIKELEEENENNKKEFEEKNNSLINLSGNLSTMLEQKCNEFKNLEEKYHELKNENEILLNKINKRKLVPVQIKFDK